MAAGMEVFKLFGSILIDTSDANKSISKTESKMEKVGNSFKNGAKTVAKWGAAVGVAAAGAVVALGKQSLEAYAEFEQLKGGIETLFDDSSDKMMEYAQNAYKTAGLSANDYMETATSFSASLLQSLGGDTEKAADYADLAITDMSDNANKMGTDMERIQDAYQGFAKGNMTMLDNLKLGYGGNQSEMERLLDDAEKISGVEYDISSYADIVDAIHVVQTEMGIAGTTAEEAEQTIEGSISMAKSAWQNLLVGFSDETADVGALVDNMVDSIAAVASNLLPRAKVFVTQLGKTIKQKIIDNAPQLATAGMKMMDKLLTGLGNGLAKILPKVPGYVIKIAGALIKQIPSMVVAGGKLIGGLLQGLNGAWTNLVKVIGSKIKSWFTWKTIVSLFKSSDSDGSHASGLNYVPYDGYKAILHKGEQVLSRTEARKRDSNSGNVTINFNGSYSFGNKGDIDYFMKESQKLINRRAVTV